MRHHTPLNFLPKRDNLHLLQAGTLIALFLCAGMVSKLLGSTGTQTASISDVLASPSISPVSVAANVIRPKVISESAVISAASTRESDTVHYYEQETGKAFSVNLVTIKTDVLSANRLHGFIRSYWIPYSDNVISEFQDPSGVSFRYFDYQTKLTTTIGTDISNLVVSPDGRQVAFIKPSDDAFALYISDNDGKNPRKILSTRTQEVRLDWPAKDILSLSSRRPDRTGSELSLVSLSGALTVLMTNRENLEYIWSPDGTKLLYSYFTPEQGVSLWYHDTSTGTEIPLGVPTSAEKCAWHGTTALVTCGVPAKNSLGRDVPANQSSTVDSIFTLDVTTGQLIQQYAGTSALLVGVIEPLVSSSERYFVFTNLFDHRLYLFPL